LKNGFNVQIQHPRYKQKAPSTKPRAKCNFKVKTIANIYPCFRRCGLTFIPLFSCLGLFDWRLKPKAPFAGFFEKFGFAGLFWGSTGMLIFSPGYRELNSKNILRNQKFAQLRKKRRNLYKKGFR